MGYFDSVESVHIESDFRNGVVATFKMKEYKNDPATFYLMECCVDLLMGSLRLLFPKSKFDFSISDKEGMFTCRREGDWSEREDKIFELFIRALTLRYLHIKYTANKKLADPAPWH